MHDALVRQHLVLQRPPLGRLEAPAPAEHRGDEAFARVREAEPARLQHVAGEEETGQREAVGDVVGATARRNMPSIRNAGSRSSRSCQGAPAPRDTARPDFGDT